MVKFDKNKIYVIDGAMGTEIQKKNVSQDYFIYENKICDGFNDILSLTNPEIIKSIHRDYIKAGATIIETNTFNANYISALDYGLSDETIDDINFRAAKIAKQVANNFSQDVYVAGVLGPTSKTLSMSPDVSDPSYRDITYDQLLKAYRSAAVNLLKGGSDLILIETVFDTLNAKAAIEAVRSLSEDVPIMISGTIVDMSGRTLSGQTVEAFWNSVKHAKPISVGLNCALGAKQMDPFLRRLHEVSGCAISAHPNAGLPNELGEYDQSPSDMAGLIKPWAKSGMVNIVGGCCGSTPSHIRKIASVVKKFKPNRSITKSFSLSRSMILSGLEVFDSRGKNFINIGERTNVTGSSRFKKCIIEKRYDDALNIARSQIRNGAQIIDINMDDGLLESKDEMIHFLKMLACEPDISRVPIMIDSSKWDILSESMRWIQGKGIINSISLKDGEPTFIARAKEIVSCGHAFVVMAFDEKGQADTLERKTEICERAYWALVKEGIKPQDIIFDPNIFAIATGIEDHDNYAVDFIEATRWIKSKLPGCFVSGGLSNLSFSFRGNPRVREMMHSVFLYHAIKAGLDMAIVNAGQLMVYDQINPVHRDLIEDVILNRRPGASADLLELAKTLSGKTRIESSNNQEWRNSTVEERISFALINGIDKFVVDDVKECFAKIGSALEVVEGPLMDGMNVVGNLFGSGQMFLPQVVKSARVMKKAVSWLEPHMTSDDRSLGKEKILLATVKGDVHDIGKNIVSIVLQCNGYDIVDLGVMVPLETILEEADKHKVTAIGLSGLITPSLDEMTKVARAMSDRKMDIPLLIGGATTSKVHTAIKIAPEYDKTVYIQNASIAVGVVNDVLSKPDAFDVINEDYEITRERRKARKVSERSLESARSNRYKLKSNPAVPKHRGKTINGKVQIKDIRDYIDWSPFAMTWGMKPKDLQTQAGRDLVKDAKKMIELLEDKIEINYCFSIDRCKKSGDDLIVDRNGKSVTYNFLRQSSKRSKPNLCLTDFVDNKDWIGSFAVWVDGIDSRADMLRIANDDYRSIMIQALGDRFAEATAEWLHETVRKKWWGYSKDESLSNEDLIKERYLGIRPAPGYPACPDHTQKIKILNWLGVNGRIELTEGLTMKPKSAICGWYFASPESKYFGIGKVPKEYIEDLQERNPLLKKYKNHITGVN